MKLVLFETTLDFRVFFSSFSALLIPCFLYNSNFWQVFWSLLLNTIPYTKVWKLFQFCKTITVLRFLWRHQSYLNFSTCTIFTMTMYFWRHLPLYQVVLRKWEIWIVMFSVIAVFRKGMKQHQKADPTVVSASEKVVSCFWAWKCPSLSFKTKNVPVAWFSFRGFYSTFFKACVTKMDCVLTVLSANN